MKAIVCHEFGNLDQVKLEDIPVPKPKDDEVLIEVKVASVSFMDWLMTDGRYQLKPELPYVPGTDAAGVVSAVGKNVKRFKPGDRVACTTWYGAYAEFMVEPEGACFHIPEAVPDIEAACVLYAYGTAYYALVERAKLAEGETLLVTGAAGGVGLAAVEIGSLLGAKVLAGIGSDKKGSLVKRYGASDVVNYTAENIRERINAFTKKEGIDVCFDTVGGGVFEQISRSMAWNGRLMPIGFASGEIPSIKANLPLIKNYSVVGAAAGPWWEKFREEAIEANNIIFSWLNNGKINPLIDKIMRLEDAVLAMKNIQQRSVKGRIALTINRT